MIKAPPTPSVDRRVRRTRSQLRDALVTLTLERGWDAVSVKDVCERADIGRSTFYVHFADKEELLLSGFDELHAALDHEWQGQAAPFAFVPSLIEHARGHLRLFRAMIGKHSGQAIQRRFRDVLTRLVEADLTRLGVDAARLRWVARYISGGFVEMLMVWLERPASLDANGLITMFQQMTAGALGALGVARSAPGP